ncbi:hypothetical protein BaRGS_00022736, partial [Batillaria attramentaria]
GARRNKVVCRACRESGHKRGDPACEFATRTDAISPVLQQTEAGSERPDVGDVGQGSGAVETSNAAVDNTALNSDARESARAKLRQ